jgi:UDP-N-acetylmuramate dehydrogenase
MSAIAEVVHRLAGIPNLHFRTEVPLSPYTRFGIGGPADVFVQTGDEAALVEAIKQCRRVGIDHLIIGGGTNLIVADEGYRGVVIRYTATRIQKENHAASADAGAELQTLVDFSIECGLKGLETLTRIPGSVGGAIYGNAGAYGHSISESIAKVRFFDGKSIRVFNRDQCEFRYRDSVFKRRKEWCILSAHVELDPASKEELQRAAEQIRTIRDEKFPPTMRCAGSIFKNLLLAALPADVAARVPEHVIREGKVPAAYFLEEVGAKGMSRGGIRVASYHANLLYNAGGGTAKDLRALIEELKTRVREQFGVQLEEEVQYVG